MKYDRRLATILIACLLSTGSHANSHLPRVNMTIRLINQSQEILTYAGVTDTNPENIFLVTPKIVMPGSHITITTISNNYNIPDLSGNFHFQAPLGKNYAFHVSDAKQMHYNKEVHFVIADGKFIPKLLALNKTPLAMTYSSELL